VQEGGQVTRAALVARAAAVVFAAGACSCSPSAQSCALSVFANVTEHVASKIPLNTQSGCAGYSNVPLASDTQALSGSEVCAMDAEDGACIACLRVACCAIVGQACDGLDTAACAAVPGVSACINGALADNCDAACTGPQ
jgi:hypothetical protein